MRRRALCGAALVTVLAHALLVWGLVVMGKSSRPRLQPPEHTSMTVVWLPPLAATASVQPVPIPAPQRTARSRPSSAADGIAKRAPVAVLAPAPTAEGPVAATQTAQTPVAPQRLNLNLRDVLKSTQIQRAPDDLGRLLDARRPPPGPSAMERAFAPLSADDSAVMSDTRMTDGSRLVKFSGGTCIRFPNPAAAGFDRIVKPLPYRC